MAQSLWYLRRNDRVMGPFPSPQINELLSSGEVTPDWEISLNETDWLTIAESEQFDWVEPDRPDKPETDTPMWREERLKARQRWLGNLEAVDTAISHDPVQDGQTRQAIHKDHIKTEALLQAEKQRRISLVPSLLGILVLLMVGIGVWLGQREKPIQAGISSAANCALPASDGINWSHCDKRGLKQAGLRARNARMVRTRLDDAQLAGADLAYAVLTGASLRNAQLGGGKFLGAELTGADFSGADLAGADMRYSVLKGATLAGTRLDSARLDKATWMDGRVCAEGSLGLCR